MNPGLGLRLDLNRRHVVVHEGGTSHVGSGVALEVFKASDALEGIRLGNHYDPTLNWDFERRSHLLTINEVSCLILFTNFGAGFVYYLEHALFLHGH